MDIYPKPCTDYPGLFFSPAQVQARNRQKAQLPKPLFQPRTESRIAALYLYVEGQPAVPNFLLLLKHLQQLEQQAMLVPRDRQLIEQLADTFARRQPPSLHAQALFHVIQRPALGIDVEGLSGPGFMHLTHPMFRRHRELVVLMHLTQAAQITHDAHYQHQRQHDKEPEQGGSVYHSLPIKQPHAAHDQVADKRAVTTNSSPPDLCRRYTSSRS